MPRMTLKNGETITLNISHPETEVLLKNERRTTKMTVIQVLLNDKILAETKSICSPGDAFCRATGRYIAAQRLLKMDSIRKLTKEDRGMLMKAMCPQLFTNRQERERKTFLRLQQKFA